MLYFRRMKRGRSTTIIRRTIAIAVLLVALAAKIPSPHCHCHESPRKQTDTSKECPFKLLRQIASTVTVATPDLNPSPVHQTFPVETQPEDDGSFEAVRALRARAPPFSPGRAHNSIAS